MRRKSNGEGTIFQRQDGRWQASLQVDGRRRTVYGRTRAECAAKLDALKRQAVANGAIPDPGRRTLGDLLDAWLETKAPNVKPRTISDYRDICDSYIRPVMGKTSLTKVTPDRIARLYAKWQRAGKPKTALKCHRVLSQALALAVRWGWLAANPCDRVDAPRYQPERKELWTPDELRAFLEGTREHWLHPFWLVAVSTGARIGELLALTWEHIDLVAGTATIAQSVQVIDGERVTTTPKTRAGIRRVSLPAETVQVLRAWRIEQAQQRLQTGAAWQAGDLVFSSRKGAPLSASTVGWALTRECKRLDLPPVTPHGLRHLHASLLLAQGVAIPAVSQRLGHANSAITMAVYAHAIGKDDSAATEAIERALAGRR